MIRTLSSLAAQAVCWFGAKPIPDYITFDRYAPVTALRPAVLHMGMYA